MTDPHPYTDPDRYGALDPYLVASIEESEADLTAGNAVYLDELFGDHCVD